MFDLVPSDIVTPYALTRHDEVIIAGISHVVASTTQHGFLLKRLDETGCAFELRHDDIARRVAAGKLTVHRARFLPEEARRRAEAPVELLATVGEAALARAQFRNALVQAALDLRRGGKLKMTDASITANMPQIVADAKVIFLNRIGPTRTYAGACSAPDLTVSPRSLRTWMKAEEVCGVAGLVDRRSLSGRRRDSFDSETHALLAEGLGRYATMNKPSKKLVTDGVELLFEEENKRREQAGRPGLLCPSRRQIHNAINDLEPYRVALGQQGVELARKAFAPVGPGVQVTRPLERVEIDEWMIDLKTVLTAAGLEHRLSPKERAALGLDANRARYWLTVAIDVRTRCILAMRISRNPGSSVAVEAVEMMLRDKGVFADAVGALSPWDMHGAPELIVTDCGAAFKSLRFMGAMQDLGIRVERTPGGMPHLRGVIERVFRTIGADLLPKLHGFTFSSLCKRGASDPDKQAALTADELCFALVRWVVDIYHRRGHAGLDGDTPLNIWRRLTREYGVLTPPDMRRRRLVFGSPLKRTLSTEGVTVMGVQYHSEALARWLLRHSGDQIDVRWHAEDIGAVAVRLGQEWVEVPAVDLGFNGVRAQSWLAAVRALRAAARREAVLSRDVVFQALADIEAMNAEAAARAGLVTQDWSDERVAHEEERLFIGFAMTDAKLAAAPAAPGMWGEALPTSAAAPFPAQIGAPRNSVSAAGEADAVPRHEMQPLGEVPQDGVGDPFGFEDK